MRSCRGRAVSNHMLAAAVDSISRAAAESAEAAQGAPTRLLPPVGEARRVAREVAVAIATAAVADGVAPEPIEPFERLVDRAMWQPDYRSIVDDGGGRSTATG